uniref:Uncharacterized protein n=1 Tax=Kasler Point virus TaxID=3139874 RepID=A0AAN0LJ88_9VIRU
MSYHSYAKSYKIPRNRFYELIDWNEFASNVHYYPDKKVMVEIPMDRKPIDWSPEKGIQMIEIFSQFEFPYRYHLKQLQVEGFENELVYFALALDAYRLGGGYMDLKKIIELCSLGPKTAKLFKNLRTLAFKRKICAMDFSLEPEDIDEGLLPRFLDDIEHIFNYRRLVFWRESINDMEEYSTIPVETNPDLIQEFRDTLRLILNSHEIRESPDYRLEIILETTRSKTLINGNSDWNFHRKIKRCKEEADVERCFSKSLSTCKRCIIPVCPAGTRDTVILEWSDLNTVKLIERKTLYHLSQMTQHTYGLSERETKKTIWKFLKGNSDKSFLCRDITKEGLTKPRYLLKLMLEELSKFDKTFEPYINFYESFNVEGFEGRFKRGHGQGMANALTTLMQIVLTHMINNKLMNRGFETQISSLNYNDDNVTAIPSDYLDEVWDIEGEIFKGLGILRSEKKSFFSNQGFIFCEQYLSLFYPTMNRKYATTLFQVLLSFGFTYPYEAKRYLSSISHIEEVARFLPEIVQFYGYEFFRDEHLYPISFGGWIPDSLGSYSTGLLMLEDLEFSEKIIRAYNASKITKSHVLPRKYQDPKYLEFESIYDQILASQGLGGIELDYLATGKFSKLYNTYALWREDKKMQASYRTSVHKMRQKEYLKPVKKISFFDFKDELYRTMKFVLPRYLLNFREPQFFEEKIYRDPYVQDTPICNYLALMGVQLPISSPFREEYSISKREFNYSKKKDEIFKAIELFGYDESSEGIPLDEESFLNLDAVIDDPIEFLVVHYQIYGCCVYPKFDLPINEKKKSVYGEFLSLDDYIFLSSVKYERWGYQKTKLIESILNITDVDDISEFLEEIVSSRIPEKEEILSISSDQSGQDDLEYVEEIVKSMRRRFLPTFKVLEGDALVRILLGQEDPYEYEYEDELREASTFSQIYYYRRDSTISRLSSVDNVKKGFEKFLNIPSLNNLLQQVIKDGYLKDLGEVLGMEVPQDDSEEDFGINLYGD